jgi:hypothetical protein
MANKEFGVRKDFCATEKEFDSVLLIPHHELARVGFELTSRLLR